MSTTSAVLEQKLLRTAKRRYTRRGYNVLLQPRGEDLPHFLSGFTPDMVAYKDHESIVVEVKSRADLPASENMIDLANAVHAQEGWRFDLVVVNPKTPPLIDTDVDSLERSEIAARLSTARLLLREGESEAAIVLAYSAVEATLRLIATQQHVHLEDQRPSYIVRKYYSVGILSREDYELLEHGLHVRNVIVHGFRLPKAEPELAEALIHKVEELLQTRATDLAM